MLIDHKATIEKLKFLAAREVPDPDNDDAFNSLFDNDASDIYDKGIMHGEALLARELLAMIEVPQPTKET